MAREPTSDSTRRNWIRQLLLGTAVTAARPGFAAGAAETSPRRWQIGHHFWNWDHAWNRGDLFERRLQLTKETGYEGFEAKPEEIGRPAMEVRELCARLGVACAAIGGGVQSGVEYALAA